MTIAYFSWPSAKQRRDGLYIGALKVRPFNCTVWWTVVDKNSRLSALDRNSEVQKMLLMRNQRLGVLQYIDEMARLGCYNRDPEMQR